MDISVIILSYNTREITLRCLHELDALCASSHEIKVQVVVVDNASTDGSVESLGTYHPRSYRLDTVYNTENVGFSKGNNIGLQKAQGRYVLYLNSDVMVQDTANPIDLHDLIAYMNSHRDVGALTVRVNLPSGQVDPAAHRGFPTPWRSLTYFLKFEKLVRIVRITHKEIRRIMGGYHLLGEDLGSVHEIDSGTAAFLLCPKTTVDELGGFDEQFFMYGEDLDLCYRMRAKGYKIVWYPRYSVTHLKYQSGLRSVDSATQRKIRWHFYDAMERFYAKHYKEKYCPCVNVVILTIIRVLKLGSK